MAGCLAGCGRREASDLLEVAGQSGECRLRRGKISRLQILAERAKRGGNRSLLRRSGLRAESLLEIFSVMMVAAMMAMRLRRALLGVLLHGGVILLRRLKISRLQVFPELREGLQERVAAVLAGARNILRQRGVILLRLRQISGLQVLAELLKLGLELLKIG